MFRKSNYCTLVYDVLSARVSINTGSPMGCLDRFHDGTPLRRRRDEIMIITLTYMFKSGYIP